MYKQLKRNKGGLARMAGGGQPSKVLSGTIMAGASWNSVNPTLADRLTEATGMPTYNAAVGATTSADTYKQLIDFIEAGGSFEEGANVFLQAGGADFLKGVSRRDTEENLDKILTELEKQGVNVVLTGSPNASSYEQVISNNFDPESDPIYKNLVAKHSNVVLVDSMGEILQDKSLLDDPIHPNAEGWEVYNDSVLGALNQLKQREDQVVQKEEPVDIPQEIEKITQTSTPEITYTPTTEVEETVDIPEEIERITNKSPEQYTPDVQVDEYVSEDENYRKMQPNTIEETEEANREKNNRVSELLSKLTENNDGNRLADYQPINNPYVNVRRNDTMDSNSYDVENENMNLKPTELLPKTIEKQPSQYLANEMNLGNYSNYLHTYNSPKLFQNNKPYYANMGVLTNGSSNDNLMEKINYMIHLLEEQQMEKTANITEEFILYIFLGVFVIFTVDSFTRVGKYVR
jgi:lysophospholipase L1-like esterase